MQRRSHRLVNLALGLLLGGLPYGWWPADAVGAKTVALWLFDEPVGLYPSSVLDDSSDNDYPLVLGPGGQIVPGKYGHALEPTEPAALALSSGLAQKVSAPRPAAVVPGQWPANPEGASAWSTRIDSIPCQRIRWGPTYTSPRHKNILYLNGDFIAAEVEWLGKRKDLSELAGRTVQLVFRLRGSKLYAMQFVRR